MEVKTESPANHILRSLAARAIARAHSSFALNQDTTASLGGVREGEETLGVASAALAGATIWILPAEKTRDG